MKRISGTFIISFCLLSIMLSVSLPVNGDVLKYRDDQGRLVLVDSPKAIPPRYRNRVEIVPSGKAADKLDNNLTKLLLNGCTPREINRYFLKYLFLNRWGFGLLTIFLLMIFLPIIFKNAISSINTFLILLFFLIIFHLFVFVPSLQKRSYLFTGVIRHIEGISFPVEAGIRYKILSIRIHSEILPLIPLNVYAELLELERIQKTLRIHR